MTLSPKNVGTVSANRKERPRKRAFSHMKTMRIWKDDGGAVFEPCGPSIAWLINHGGACWPKIQAVDQMGRELHTEVRHVNANTAILLLDHACTGRAFID